MNISSSSPFLLYNWSKLMILWLQWSYVLLNNSVYGVKWAISGTPPHSECHCYVCTKSLEFHLLFYKIFPKIQSEKTRKSRFWLHVWIIYGNLCENKLFCFVFSFVVFFLFFFLFNPWKSRTIFHQKVWKSNLLYGGRVEFFWKSPMNRFIIIFKSMFCDCKKNSQIPI